MTRAAGMPTIARGARVRIPLYPKQRDFLQCQKPIKGFTGGRGCVAAETDVGGTPIAELPETATVSTLFGVSSACSVGGRGRAELYRVRTKAGREVTATLRHKMLTPLGWRRLASLCVGDFVAHSDTENVSPSSEIPTDCLGRYYWGLRRGGELAHPALVAAEDKVSQFLGPHGSIVLPSRDVDDNGLHSTGDCDFPSVQGAEIECLRLGACCKLLRGTPQTDRRSTGQSGPLRAIRALLSPESFDALYSTAFRTSHSPCIRNSDFHSNANWDRIQDISFARFGEFYDLHVPGLSHYAAQGLWHHNSGKSTVGAFDLLLRSEPNCLYMVMAPTYKMLERATFRSFKAAAERIGVWPGDDGYYKQEGRVAGRNGAEYIFCSADKPESLRGPDASGAWGDEIQDVDEEAYRTVRGCLRQHGRLGWMTATFTPGSPDHWTSREFIFNPDVERAAFFRASLSENVFVDEEYYKSQLANFAASPLALRREVYGECVYLAGAEWLPDYFENVLIAEWPQRKRGSLLVISLDSSLGKDSKIGDYAAYVICLFQDGTLYVDADMRQGQDSSMIAQWGVELYRKWRPDYFVVEQEMGQHLLINEMHRIADEQKVLMAITPMDTEKINKKVRIRRLTPYVSQRRFRFLDKSPGARILLDQMKSFGAAGHDDGPDSLEYNVRMLVKATTGMVLPPQACRYPAPMMGIAS